MCVCVCTSGEVFVQVVNEWVDWVMIGYGHFVYNNLSRGGTPMSKGH